MAIGNALGSNVFNICMALGVPWLIKTAITYPDPYKQMKDNGIVMFIFFLQLVNVIWLTMIASNGFKMYAWMAPIFILIYFLVIIPAVALA